MTSKEAERLIRVEERQKTMQGDINELRKDIKEIKDMLQADASTRQDYITKRGMTKLLGVILSLATLFFIFYDHIKEAFKQ